MPLELDTSMPPHQGTPQIPSALLNEERRYRSVLLYGNSLALILHLVFVLFFQTLGIQPLVLFNIGSIALYALCFWLIRLGHDSSLLILASLEVIGHAWLAVTLLGWASGFHYYLFALAPLAFFNPHWTGFHKILYLLCVCLALVLLDQWALWNTPDSEASQTAIDMARHFNYVTAFAVLAYFTFYYALTARRALMQLDEVAATDQLTGLYNRRRISEVIERNVASHARSGQPLSLILMDIDDFKQVNDRLGHDCGDQVLTQVSRCLEASVRAQDTLARWGGEEFLLLLPNTDQEGAQTLGEKLLESVSAIQVACPAGQVSVTLTAGAGTLLPGEDFSGAFSRIDRALLAGKVAGKNRIIAATSLPPQADLIHAAHQDSPPHEQQNQRTGQQDPGTGG